MHLWDMGCGIGDTVQRININFGEDEISSTSEPIIDSYGQFNSRTCCFINWNYSSKKYSRPLLAIGRAGGWIGLVELYSGRTCLRLDQHTQDMILCRNDIALNRYRMSDTVRFNFSVRSHNRNIPYFDTDCVPSVLHHPAIGFILMPHGVGDICIYHVNQDKTRSIIQTNSLDNINSQSIVSLCDD